MSNVLKVKLEDSHGDILCSSMSGIYIAKIIKQRGAFFGRFTFGELTAGNMALAWREFFDKEATWQGGGKLFIGIENFGAYTFNEGIDPGYFRGHLSTNLSKVNCQNICRVANKILDIMANEQLEFWAYLHTSGTISIKRYFDSRDLEDADESTFVAKRTEVFPAKDGKEASKIAKSLLKN